ncbi:unnamed protein product [Symbiodinium sp. CCMP2592]|nr:unnamed protein product [Symbiodinium sp. CCMP2592]
MDPDPEQDEGSCLDSWSPVNSSHSDSQRTGRSLPAPLWTLSGLLHPDDGQPSASQSDAVILLPLQTVHKAAPGLPPPSRPPGVRPVHALAFASRSAATPSEPHVRCPSAIAAGRDEVNGGQAQITRKGQEASRKAKALDQWKELLWLLGESAEAKYSQQLLMQSISPFTAGTLETYLAACRQFVEYIVLNSLAIEDREVCRTGKPATAYHQPMSYSQALGSLRYFTTSRHLGGSSPDLLTPEEASAFTMHSLKVCLLSAGAQLQAADKIRQQQGHQKSPSVQLYGRDDTLGALALQTEVTSACASGWRPTRPIARGGHHPTIEPSFQVHSSLPPVTFQLSTLGQGLSRFIYAREIEVEDTQPAFLDDAPPQAPPLSADDTQHEADAQTLPPTIPADDIEALLVESFASARDDSSDSEDPDRQPMIQEIKLFQNGPWGSVHAQQLGSDRAACGTLRSTAAFSPSDPNVAFFCRRAACRRLLDALP